MNVKTIREALKHEARNNLHGDAALNLTRFAHTATDAELIRFREILIAEPHDWLTDPNNVASVHHY